MEVYTVDLRKEKAGEAVYRDIKDTCEKYGYAVIKQFVPKEKVLSAMRTMADSFRVENDAIRKKGEYFKTQTNYQRLCVGYGENPGSGELRNARLFRIFYNPLWEADIYGMHSLFRELIILRNRLYGIKDSFCLEGPEDGLFSATRIHQFPAGGGFLQLHRDKDGELSSRNAGLPTFLHPLLIGSQKGEDFQTGGGIVKSDEKIIFYEDDLQPGDVAIYNGRTEHGVFNVDAEQTLDLTRFNGRSSILATLFKQ